MCAAIFAACVSVCTLRDYRAIQRLSSDLPIHSSPSLIPVTHRRTVHFYVAVRSKDLKLCTQIRTFVNEGIRLRKHTTPWIKLLAFLRDDEDKECRCGTSLIV